ncbi:MAG: hypothetical protein OQJ89_09325 [Kangiellaceae bacterium]|nr:hypothetical protein [Kangiellaceae bacterium]MCW8998240.1 hypothetical protein [Kangiellaceae bacterium]MCW9017153.1 hypothetical protein [Kangiellaceae bacterium]
MLEQSMRLRMRAKHRSQLDGVLISGSEYLSRVNNSTPGNIHSQAVSFGESNTLSYLLDTNQITINEYRMLKGK